MTQIRYKLEKGEQVALNKNTNHKAGRTRKTGRLLLAENPQRPAHVYAAVVAHIQWGERTDKLGQRFITCNGVDVMPMPVCGDEYGLDIRQ